MDGTLDTAAPLRDGWTRDPVMGNEDREIPRGSWCRLCVAPPTTTHPKGGSMTHWTRWDPVTMYRITCPRCGDHRFMPVLVHTENDARMWVREHDAEHADADRRPTLDAAE